MAFLEKSPDARDEPLDDATQRARVALAADPRVLVAE
jgi:hypothetical protein